MGSVSFIALFMTVICILIGKRRLHCTSVHVNSIGTLERVRQAAALHCCSLLTQQLSLATRTRSFNCRKQQPQLFRQVCKLQAHNGVTELLETALTLWHSAQAQLKLDRFSTTVDYRHSLDVVCRSRLLSLFLLMLLCVAFSAPCNDYCTFARRGLVLFSAWYVRFFCCLPAGLALTNARETLLNCQSVLKDFSIHPHFRSINPGIPADRSLIVLSNFSHPKVSRELYMRLDFKLGQNKVKRSGGHSTFNISSGLFTLRCVRLAVCFNVLGCYFRTKAVVPKCTALPLCTRKRRTCKATL